MQPPRHGYSYLATLASSQNSTSVAGIVDWALGCSYMAWASTDSPPFQYSYSPILHLSCFKCNKLIRMDILKLHTKTTWCTPPVPLGTRMVHYRDHFLHLLIWFCEPALLRGYSPFAWHLYCHWPDSYFFTPAQNRDMPIWGNLGNCTCQICHHELDMEEHSICRCTVYYKYWCLFQEGCGSLQRVMDY